MIDEAGCFSCLQLVFGDCAGSADRPAVVAVDLLLCQFGPGLGTTLACPGVRITLPWIIGVSRTGPHTTLAIGTWLVTVKASIGFEFCLGENGSELEAVAEDVVQDHA